MVIFMSARTGSLGILRGRAPNTLHFLCGLAARDPHDFHQLGGHFSGHLILDTTAPVGIGLEKSHDLFFGNTRPVQTIEKLAVTDPPPQSLNPSHELLAI